jgi:hypothetical protein
MLPYHIVDVLTAETDRYAHQVISKYDRDDVPYSLKRWTDTTLISKYDRDDLPYSLKRWTDTTRNEMYTFIALLMLMARNGCNSERILAE